MKKGNVFDQEQELREQTRFGDPLKHMGTNKVIACGQD